MFNFKELLKIFKINWKNVLNEISPKGNQEIINENFVNSFDSGAIINIVSTIIRIIWQGYFYIFRLIIMLLGIVLVNKYKKKKVNSATIFILFVVTSLGMLGSFLSVILSLPMVIYGIEGFFMSLLCNSIDTISFTFITLACIDFCKKAHDNFESEKQNISEETIKLKTIKMNDVSMHVSVKCPNCQANVSIDALFCSNCGTKLK